VTNKTGSIEIREYLKENGKLVNEFLEEYFDGRELDAPQVLKKSMRYSLLAGGKRLRPILALASYEACGGDPIDIIQPASALEVVHTYSLIHDDLPAMDDDDLRRGKPTNHKVFGEAMAILAGDALRSLEAARELSLAAGARGMVGGQVQDILSENAEPDKETLSYIHTHKTGALIRASVRIGAILAGADNELLGALTSYGEKLGLAFQIIDDILDIKGDETVLGKPVGSDLENNKMTYPALYGLDASSERAGELIGEAIEALSPFSKKADTLREIARYVLKRKS
jgi:geranylgeranyl diphosphate synthase type II